MDRSKREVGIEEEAQDEGCRLFRESSFGSKGYSGGDRLCLLDNLVRLFRLMRVRLLIR